MVVTAWNLFVDVPDEWWIAFWKVWIVVFAGGALVVTCWFTVGGFFDLRELIRRVTTHRVDLHDDGRVVHRDGASSPARNEAT